MKLDLINNAEHSLFHACSLFHSSQEDDPENKLYDDQDAIIYEQKGNKMTFALEGYHRPPQKYLSVISLLLLFQSLELLIKDALIDRFGESVIWKKTDYSINLSESIELYNKFSAIKLEKNILLEYKKHRNALEHFELKNTYNQILEIIKYLFCEIWILYKTTKSINIINHFQWDLWKDQEVPFHYTLIELLKDSKRIKSYLPVLIDRKNHGFCLDCGFQSVEDQTLICMVCNNENDFLI
ncbi:hypothetical protein Lepto782_22455 (plasmid) [Leptospira interrogans serovar Canicola]|uniref:Uncharacterized protein n=1 Tax=Leptospira interrogans serovar Canicola TaxID=211880 RepID=A0AAP9WIB8_LEPIR|nr:hypothetical protein [Leptospira interrogans]QOI44969.1 hypothetical protein Lepto782_22455 [Leptospira interrogans serovar Canicola]